MRLGLRGALGALVAGATIVGGAAGGVGAAPPDPGATAPNVAGEPSKAGPDEPAPATREAVYPYDYYLGDEYPEITAAVPEYGGWYIDHETGTLFVHLTVPSDDLAQRVKALLVENHYLDLDSVRVLDLDGVRVERVAPLQARYSWQQLVEWRAAWGTVEYRAPGITSSGLSGEHNRFEIGVTDLDHNRPAVEEVLASVGIPLDAVHLEEESPFVGASTLSHRHRPLVGGLQISFQAGFLGRDTRQCTLGFNALRAGVNGFVTNSHCSRTMGELDNGRYWQPTRPLLDGDQIGHETVDPGFFTGWPCPANRRCRHSDANFVQRAADQTATRGGIARVALGSTSWAGNTFFRVTSENPRLEQAHLNQTFQKVGRTTGRTQGPLVEYCRNVRFYVRDARGVPTDTGITLLCQGIVRAGVAGGDSGSPVFRITNHPRLHDVELAGVLSTEGRDAAGNLVFSFSPMNRIQSELGFLSPCAAGVAGGGC